MSFLFSLIVFSAGIFITIIIIIIIIITAVKVHTIA